MNIQPPNTLLPDSAGINAHLFEICSPAFVSAFPDSWIEVAFARPDGKLNEAKNFSAFDLKAAADFAAAKNVAGFNVYTGVALRQGKQPRNGRAGKANFLASAFAWIEYDHAGDHERVVGICQREQLEPAMMIVTGTVPNQRVHLYFKLDKAVIDPAELEAANVALRQKFDSDAVQDVARVLRLGGTISYPSSDKKARGYVTELTTVHALPDPRRYSINALCALAPSAATNNVEDWFQRYGDFICGKPGKADDELMAMLETSRTKSQWHNSMRDATASMAGKEWSRLAMLLACAPYCNKGANDPELIELVDSALAKYSRDQDEDRARVAQEIPKSPATIAAMPMVLYRDIASNVAKKWIMKGVIARGETSAWVGPPKKGKKSSLLTDIAFHIAAGRDWRSHIIKERCGVLYLALERGGLVRRRFEAYKKRYGVGDLPIAVVSQVIDLMNKRCVKSIINTIRAAEAEFKCSVGLVIIDTFGKGIADGGGDENQAKDQNITLANLRRVEDATDVHIAIIGHTGKDETKGARGSNAHLGDVDIMNQCSGDIMTTVLTTHANDQAEGVLTRFKTESVEIGIDDDGEEITAWIVTSDDADDVDGGPERPKLSRANMRAMEILSSCVLEEGKPGWITGTHPTIKVVPMTTWAEWCERYGLSSAPDKKSRDRVFRRAKDQLQTMHRIGFRDGNVWIAYDD